jgi:transcription elongation factor Elf1
MTRDEVKCSHCGGDTVLVQKYETVYIFKCNKCHRKTQVMSELIREPERKGNERK